MASIASAQPPRVPEPLAAGTSAISGRLIDDLTDAPIANCEVRAASAAGSSAVTTGADGTYNFTDIADGDYFVMLRCPSHVTVCLKPGDASSVPCGTMTLFRDQHRSNVDFRLTPGAVVRGRVVDGNGKPVPKATVRLGRPFDEKRFFPTLPTLTKDDGTFELQNLADGKWPLEVDVPRVPGAPRPPVIFYPGVLSRDEAGFVELVAGRIKDNVTITVPSVLDSTLTVRMPPPDETMTSVMVALVRTSPLMTLRLQLDAEGQAVVRGLTEGRYFVTATAVHAQRQWVAFQPVDFVQDSLEVSLNLQPAGRIRGRIVSDRDGMPPLSDATIGAVWVDEDVSLNPLAPEESAVAADGSFEIDGVFGRRRLQLNRFDSDWRIQSVLHGRSDVTTTGIDVAPNSTTEVTVIVRRR